jgi:hypothetical protein
MKPNKLYLNRNTTRQDVECVILAKLGFTYEAIGRATNLTKAQVGYRLHLAGISPSEYRRGESSLAQRIMKIANEDSRQYFDTIASQIKRYLKD